MRNYPPLLLFIIAADTRAGAAADLGYPKTQYTFSAFLTFSGGNNHARIGNGNTDAGNDFCKGIIINAVIEGGGVNIVGMADSGYADGMRPTPNTLSRCSACIKSPANS